MSYIFKTPLKLPFLGCTVRAGFPSPADDWLEDQLDLNHLLIKNPPATFLLRVSGDSMKNAGILDKSVLVVDRSITAKPGMIVVACLNGDMTVKYYACVNGMPLLRPANPEYPDISMTEDSIIWGVVTSTLLQF